MAEKIKIVLAGNPNCGKSTIFNALTGTRQHVGNYSGVTVEKKSGICRIGDRQVELVDLPGIYSLSSSSAEELVAFHELLSGNVDLILNIIDSGNPQRNLYLTSQLAELNIPMVMVFNMADEAHERGLEFDHVKLEKWFGAPIVECVGATGAGLPELKNEVARILDSGRRILPATPSYGELTDQAISELTEKVREVGITDASPVPPRYFAIKLLEKDEATVKNRKFADLLAFADEWSEKLTRRLGVNHQVFMADRRYGMIAGACREAITLHADHQRQLSDTIDKVVANRFFGVPIFLLMMYLVFVFTFTCAEPLVRVMEFLMDGLGQTVAWGWPEARLPYLRDLVLDGVIGGVGGVLVFLPNIMTLFLAIAFLEGTGYMARAAFVMDGFMHKFGLHGKSFIPMLLGFGCTVPAIMATRTIESERDRLTTIAVLPLMSCGARLPIYSLFIPIFFPGKLQGVVMLLIYLIGVVLALFCAGLLKRTIFAGGDEFFVMELPPYRMPTFKSLLLHMLERMTMYLKKAGTVIFAASVILFVLNTYPVKEKLSRPYDALIENIHSSKLTKQDKARQIEQLNSEKKFELLEYSIAGRIGRKIGTVLQPLGFDWRTSSALVGAFAGKELFVSQLGILYAGDGDSEETLAQKIRRDYTPLQGFCIMLFCLISMPCIGTVAVVRKESGSWLFAGAQLLGLTCLAYAITLVVYQVARLL
ncbi:MAG: ferrous iron transport protein B [Victivallaceae bacterium]|nr:ferrous iron transport protein B [Victivallaceae bacterium]